MPGLAVALVATPPTVVKFEDERRYVPLMNRYLLVSRLKAVDKLRKSKAKPMTTRLNNVKPSLQWNRAL